MSAHSVKSGGHGIGSLSVTWRSRLPRPKLFDSPGDRGRFLREARAAPQLCHPRIVPVYHVAEIRPANHLWMALQTSRVDRDSPDHFSRIGGPGGRSFRFARLRRPAGDRPLGRDGRPRRSGCRHSTWLTRVVTLCTTERLAYGDSSPHWTSHHLIRVVESIRQIHVRL